MVYIHVINMNECMHLCMHVCMYACMYVCTHTFETLLSSASEVIDSMPDCTEVGLDRISKKLKQWYV